MSNSSDRPVTTERPRLHGLLAEYQTPQQLIDAARHVRDAGYKQWDTFSPFPVHGIDPAMGIRMTRLPWVVFCAGLTGGLTALGFQYWANAADYPFLVSGKPMWSVAANIPITFELTVLFAAISCFLGMLIFNRLPMHSHPLDRLRRFARVTDDRFFVVVSAGDPKFDESDTSALLAKTGPTGQVERVMEDTESSAELPRGLIYALLIIGAAATVPFATAALARASTSKLPRRHIVPDMDFQDKFKTQRANPFFADGREMRPQVEGTVAVGELDEDDHFYRGKVGRAWATTFPARVPLNKDTMERGRQRFDIYCSPCHGVDGAGKGMVHQRAQSLLEGTWVPPTDLHQVNLLYKPVGELFYTIGKGIRNMPGYASQIEPADRWAVVLYVRALQRSRDASVDELPPALKGAL